MKWKLISCFVIIATLFSCNNKTDILLQKEEISISSESKQFSFPESTSGIVDLKAFIEAGFQGLLLIQNNNNTVFEYRIDANNKLYPLKNNIATWQKISLNWNLESASLKIFINDQLQTILLIKLEDIFTINQLTIKPLLNDKEIKVRNVTFRGDSTEVPKRLKIVAFGNSTTATRNTLTGVYSQYLPELLLNQGIPNIIFNEGVRGSHTGHLTDNNKISVVHALDRFDKSVLERSPDIVIICFGLNDSWHDDDSNEPRIPLSDYEKNLRFMIESCLQNDSKVILLTPNGLGKKFEKWRYDYTLKYVQVVRKLSKEYNVSLIDQWQAFEDYAQKGRDMDELLLDGLHPNNKWHKKLAKKLTNEIVLIANSTEQ